jgi:hypothetical protein
VVGGFLILAMALLSRIRWITKTGAGTKIDYTAPYGYKPIELPKPRQAEPQTVRVVQ